MRLNNKAQNVIEYMILVAAAVAGVLGVAGPGGPVKPTVEKSLNQAVETISGSYFWKLGPLSPCSGCGPCTQTRTVSCENGAGEPADEGLCLTQGPRPPSTIDSYISCGGFTWWEGPFTDCSRACGGGTKTHAVECHDSGGNTVADSFCTSVKPPETVPCGTGACYDWAPGSECSGPCNTPCGVGTCKRAVPCVDTVTGAVVASTKCNIATKPSDNLSCSTGVVCEYDWKPRDWTNCSPTCGPGTHTRDVDCVRLNDNRIMTDETLCAPMGPKPPISEACNDQPCNHWGVVGGWTICHKPGCDVDIADPSTYSCGVPCGGGVQEANIKCLNAGGAIQSDANCPLAESGPKPDAQRDCNTGACLWKYGNWSLCDENQNCGIGEKERTVECEQGPTSDPRDTRPPLVPIVLQYCEDAAGSVPNLRVPCDIATATTCLQWTSCDRLCYGYYWDGGHSGACLPPGGCGLSTWPRTYSCYETSTGSYIAAADTKCIFWGLTRPVPPDRDACCATGGCYPNRSCQQFSDPLCGGYWETCWWAGEGCPDTLLDTFTYCDASCGFNRKRRIRTYECHSTNSCIDGGGVVESSACDPSCGLKAMKMIINYECAGRVTICIPLVCP